MNTKKGDKKVKTLQERYDELRVKYEDAVYRYRDKDIASVIAHRECENLFAQLRQIESEMMRR